MEVAQIPSQQAADRPGYGSNGHTHANIVDQCPNRNADANTSRKKKGEFILRLFGFSSHNLTSTASLRFEINPFLSKPNTFRRRTEDPGQSSHAHHFLLPTRFGSQVPQIQETKDNQPNRVNSCKDQGGISAPMEAELI